MKAGKDMSPDELLRRLNWYREEWARRCANVSNLAFRAAARKTHSVRMPKHLRDALDGIEVALPLNPRDWTPERRAHVLATKLVPGHERSLLALDGLAGLYAETRQALREVRLKRREESGQ